MAGFHPAIGTVNTGLATGESFQAAYAVRVSSLPWPRARAPTPAAMVVLSLLAHGAALLSLVLFLPNRIEPPALPEEATVTLLFEPAPAAPPAVPDAAPPSAQDTVPAPVEPVHADEPTPPAIPQSPAAPAPVPLQDTQLVPPAPATPVQTPSPKRPAAARPNSAPARPLPGPAPQEAPIATAGPVASVPLVPPRPVASMETNRAPTYPESARRRGEQGRVMLRVSVSADGTPLDVALAETSGHASLDSAALAAVRQWRFIPATQAGKSVPAVAEIPVRFRLDN